MLSYDVIVIASPFLSSIYFDLIVVPFKEFELA